MTAPPPNEHLLSIRRDSDCIGDRRGFVCLDRNERPSPWPDDVFRQMLAKLDPWDLTHYPDLGPLYQRLVRATGLPQERLCVGAGSDSLIRRMFQAYLRPGDTVVTPDPTYGMYAVWSRLCQARHVAVPYGADLRLPIDKFMQAIADAKPRIVAIANPDQPTGSLLSRAEILLILEACERVGAICIVDEAYFPFSPSSMMADVPDHASLVVMRSFSKSAGIAGLRVGFAAGDESIIRALHALRSPGEVSSVSAIVATFLLERPDLTDVYVQDVEEGRSLLIDAWESLGYSAPRHHGNFQLLGLPPGMESGDLVKSLENNGFLIKGGFTFPPLRDFVRVTLDGRAVIQPFVKCLREVCAETRPAV